MGRVDDLLCRVLVAFAAGPGHFLSGGQRLLEQAAVIHRFCAPGHKVPGRVDYLPFRDSFVLCEIPDRDGDQDKYEHQACDPTVAGILHLHTSIKVLWATVILACSNLGLHSISIKSRSHDQGHVVGRLAAESLGR